MYERSPFQGAIKRLFIEPTERELRCAPTGITSLPMAPLGASWVLLGVGRGDLAVLGGLGVIFGFLGARFGDFEAVLGGLGGVWEAVDGLHVLRQAHLGTPR